jgi:hypothetical protein
VPLHEVAGAFGGPVVHRDDMSVPGEIAGQIAAHHGKPGHADLS